MQAYKLAAKAVLEVRKKLNAAFADKALLSGTAAEFAKVAGLEGEELAVAGWLDKASCNNGAFRRRFDEKRGEWIYSVR